MSSCHCQATEAHFSDAVARRDLQRYRSRGPDRTTRLMLQALKRGDIRDATVLDIGGGIGVLSLELLAAGVSAATHVEAAPAYSDVAAQEARSRRLGDRLRLMQGDAVDVDGQLPDAELVALDRVVCCYPDWAALLNVASKHCRRQLALSYPRDRWYVRLFVLLDNGRRRLARNAFRTFVHPVSEMERFLTKAGFTRVAEHNGLVWAVAMYARNIANE
jgi:magnesium-protoporphyrin O-methyltransferase